MSRYLAFRAIGLNHKTIIVNLTTNLETSDSQSCLICSAIHQRPSFFLSCESIKLNVASHLVASHFMPFLLVVTQLLLHSLQR